MSIAVEDLYFYPNASLLSSTPRVLPTKQVDTAWIQLSTRDRLIISMFYVILSLLGTFLCSFLSYVILKVKRLRERPNLILLNLFLSDVLFTITQMPHGVISLNMKPPPRTMLLSDICAAFVLITYGTGMTSITSVSLISMDRYLAIAHPYFYGKHMHRRYCVVLFTYPWLQTFLVLIPTAVIDGYTAYDVDYYCVFAWEKASKAYILFVAMIYCILPVTVLLYTNIRVHLIARRHIHKVTKRQCPVEVSTDNYQREIAISAPQMMDATAVNNCMRPRSSSLPACLDLIHAQWSNNQLSYMEQNAVDCLTAKDKRKHDDVQSILPHAKITLHRSAPFAVHRKLTSQINCSAETGTLDSSLFNKSKSTSFLQNVRERASTFMSLSSVLTRIDFESLRHFRLQIKIVMSTYLLVFVFVLCWFTFLIPRYLYVLGQPFSQTLAAYSAMVPSALVILDPLVVIICRKDIRTAFICLFKKRTRDAVSSIRRKVRHPGIIYQ